MSIENKYQYFVEGDTEKKLLTELKREGNLIIPGTVRVFNVVQKRMSSAMLSSIPNNTTAILMFDTDTKKVDILMENLSKLGNNKSVKETWCVMQVENLEDELIRSTDIKEIKDLTDSRSNTDFKRDIIREKNLMTKLRNHNFDLAKMWVTEPSKEYVAIENKGVRLKIEEV